jgi:1-acyl-sn-glycerol-3-phosphate acyltransferase
MGDEVIKPELFIDIDKVFIEKNPRLYKILPGFIIKYLKRIIHQDEINHIINSNKHLEGLDFVDAVLDYFKVEISVIGSENIPKEGNFIFVANHPIGSIDGLIFIQQVGKFFGPSKSIINDLLMNIANLKPLFVGVNKHGTNSKDAIDELDKIFSSDTQVLIFPAGLASRKVNGKIYDLEWKKTFITRSIKYKRDVIPVHITGQLSNFFYTFANLRKALRIKSNLEMLYLVDETMKQKEKKFAITFGKPISFEMFDSSKTHFEWAQKVKEHIYQIKNDKYAKFV